MVDFFNTLAGREFAAHIKTIAIECGKKRNKNEELAQQIYSQLVVSEFYKKDGLSYEEMKAKAKEAADAFFE